jgi:hypothetical protein
MLIDKKKQTNSGDLWTGELKMPQYHIELLMSIIY